MSDGNGQEPGQDGQLLQMTSEERGGYWIRFAALSSLAVFPLLLSSRLLIHEQGRLQELWGKSDSRQILLMLLALPAFFLAILSVLLFRMCRRKLKYGTFLPSGEELRRARARRRRPTALWKRAALAVCYCLIATTSTMSAVESMHGSSFRWVMACFFWMAAILFTIPVFQPSEKIVLRAIHGLFGRLGYIQITSPGLMRRIQARFHVEIDQLKSLGFDLLFWEGETFSIFSLLLVFPALVLLVMFCNREVIALSGRSRVLTGSPVLASADRSAYANLSRLGAKYRTRFRSGRILETRNNGESSDEIGGPMFFRRVHPGASISETWRHHQEAVRAMEGDGELTDHELNFDVWEDIVRQASAATFGNLQGNVALGNES